MFTAKVNLAGEGFEVALIDHSVSGHSLFQGSKCLPEVSDKYHF